MAAAAARAGRSEGSPCQRRQGSYTLHTLESQFCFLYCKTERSLGVGEGNRKGREDPGNPDNWSLGLSRLLQGLHTGGSTLSAGTRRSSL